MSNVDFGAFKWYTPRRASQLAITIPNPNHLNLNPKLRTQMPTHIQIGTKDNGQCICIRECPDTGYKVPKGGSIEDKSILQDIISSGVRLPARYSVEKEDDCWLAILDEDVLPKVSEKKAPRKPRKNDFQQLEKELKSLDEINS